jgi:hypothetical protein
MKALLELREYWMVGLVCGAAFGCAVAIYLVTERSPLAARLQPYRCIPVAAISAVAVLFGLFAAFLGADIWERIREERSSIEHEIAAIQTLEAIADELGEDGQSIKQTLKNYVDICLPKRRLVLDRERADDAPDRVVQTILGTSPNAAAEATSRGEMLAAAREIRLARAERLHLYGTHADPHKWLAVILLGVLTQVTIAFVNDFPKGTVAGLIIFSLAFAVSLSALAIHEAPLTRSESVPIDILRGTLSGSKPIGRQGALPIDRQVTWTLVV